MVKLHKKSKIWSLIGFTIVLFLFSTISTSQAISWSVGDTHLWGARVTSNNNWLNLDTDFRNVVDISLLSEYQLEITSIDRVAKRYEAIPLDVNGINPERGFSYAWDDFVDDYLLSDGFLNVEYIFDINTNQTILTDFQIEFVDIIEWLLIETEWEKINNAFVDFFDASVVLASVPDFYAPENITEITLGDFLGETTSYKIMSRSSLESALRRFSNDNKWTFFFDLSGVITYPVYNDTLGRDEYYSYDVYKTTLELKYTKDGQLDSYYFKTETTKTVDNVFMEDTYEEEIASGGIKAVGADFAIIAAISGFISIFLIARIIHRKRRN